MKEKAERRIAYLEGMIEGITMYAIWKNGDQLVGCLQKPLKEVLKPYQDEIIQIKNAYRL